MAYQEDSNPKAKLPMGRLRLEKGMKGGPLHLMNSLTAPLRLVDGVLNRK